MSRTEHLVYVESTLELTEQERKAVKVREEVDMDRIVKRRSQIAARAHHFLQKLGVPLDS